MQDAIFTKTSTDLLSVNSVSLDLIIVHNS